MDLKIINTDSGESTYYTEMDLKEILFNLRKEYSMKPRGTVTLIVTHEGTVSINFEEHGSRRTAGELL